MGKEAPDKVLSRIYVNLENLKLKGDRIAIKVMEKLRLIVSWNYFWWINVSIRTATSWILFWKQFYTQMKKIPWFFIYLFYTPLYIQFFPFYGDMLLGFRLQGVMEQLAGYLELFVISNCLIRHPLPRFHWAQGIICRLHLVG